MKAFQRCSIPAGSDLRALLPKPARASSLLGLGPIVSAGKEPRESFVVMLGGETLRDGAGDAQPGLGSQHPLLGCCWLHHVANVLEKRGTKC